LTSGLPCNTSETVDFDTPARAATSVMVGRRFISLATRRSRASARSVRIRASARSGSGQQPRLIGEAEDLGVMGDLARGLEPAGHDEMGLRAVQPADRNAMPAL
jgi:hypothetical protein